MRLGLVLGSMGRRTVSIALGPNPRTDLACLLALAWTLLWVSLVRLTSGRPSVVLYVVTPVVVAAYIRRRLEPDSAKARVTPAPDSRASAEAIASQASKVLADLASRRRLEQIVGSVIVAVAIGGMFGMTRGVFKSVGEFCNASSPLVAGLLVGIIVDFTRTDRRELSQQLGLIYGLAAAVSAAAGNVQNAAGWVFGFCFLVVCAGIGASTCLVVHIAFRRQSPTNGDHHDTTCD